MSPPPCPAHNVDTLGVSASAVIQNVKLYCHVKTACTKIQRATENKKIESAMAQNEEKGEARSEAEG